MKRLSIAVTLLLAACANGSFGGDSGGKPIAVAQSTAVPQEYRIAPYDVLDITVFQVKDLDRVVQVGSTGTIVLPLIGEVAAGGQTTKQLEATVTAKLAANYLQNPRVSVAVKQSTGQSVTVDGAVQKPGVFPLTGTIGLSQAVALAGGVTDLASKSSVSISRLSGDQRVIQGYDLEQIQAGKVPDPTLLAGDIVIVQESAYKSGLRETARTLAPITQGAATAVRLW